MNKTNKTKSRKMKKANSKIVDGSCSSINGDSM